MHIKYEPTWTLHDLDALRMLLMLPEESVDSVVTDPPYNSSTATYGSAKQMAGSGYVSAHTSRQKPDFDSDNRDYLAWMTTILTECHRVTVTGGSLLICTDAHHLPTISTAIRAAGWAGRGIVPRKTTAGPPVGEGGPWGEYVVWARKMTPWAPAGRQSLRGVNHPRGACALTLADTLDRLVPSAGTVLDPVAGFGSTGVAALTSGRSFVAAERSVPVRAAALRRLRAVEGAFESHMPMRVTGRWGACSGDQAAAA